MARLRPLCPVNPRRRPKPEPDTSTPQQHQRRQRFYAIRISNVIFARPPRRPAGPMARRGRATNIGPTRRPRQPSADPAPAIPCSCGRADYFLIAAEWQWPQPGGRAGSKASGQEGRAAQGRTEYIGKQPQPGDKNAVWSRVDRLLLKGGALPTRKNWPLISLAIPTFNVIFTREIYFKEANHDYSPLG